MHILKSTFQILCILMLGSFKGFSQSSLPDQEFVYKKLGRQPTGSDQTLTNWAADKIVDPKLDSARIVLQRLSKAKNSKVVLSKPSERRTANNDSILLLSMATSQASNSSFSTNSIGQPIVLPSPNVANISVASAGSVDMYTGRFSYTIPLVTLKSRSISLPLSLIYSTGGAKVDENSSWVGHQWSLNAGGAISRVMKGLPDEFQGRVGPNCGGCADFDGFGYLRTKSKVNLSTLESSVDYQFKQKVVRNSNFTNLDGFNFGGGFPEAWDTQPDEFHFNFGSYSGKFVFDQDGNIVSIPYQNLKIEKTELNNATTSNVPKIVEFRVTTPDGTVYIFGDMAMASVEESRLETLSMTNRYQYIFLNATFGGIPIYFRLPRLHVKTNGQNLVRDMFSLPGNSFLTRYNFFSSTWYLKEIRTANNDDNVSFEYTDAGEISYMQGKNVQISLPNLSETTIQGQEGWFFISPSEPIVNPNQVERIYPGLQSFTYSVNEVTLKAKRLSAIITASNNRVEFKANTPRTDLIGDKRLDEILIYGNGSLVKSFRLDFASIESPLSFDLFLIDSNILMDCDVGFINEKFRILTSNGTVINQASFVEKYSNVFRAERNRIFLKSVTEYSNNGVALTPYIFTYDSQVLPRKFSYKKDRWGYYNGNTRGVTNPAISYIGWGGDLVPRSGIRLFVWDAVENGLQLGSFNGANISANGTLSQASLLKRIDLPTGGRKEITYELNTGFFGVRVKDEKDFADQGTAPTSTVNYSYNSGVQVYGTILNQYSVPFNDNESLVSSSSSPANPVYYTKGAVVGYRTSQVIRSGQGKTVFTYRNPSIEPNEYAKVYQVFSSSQTLLNRDTYPFPSHKDVDWRRGLLERVEVYNEQQLLLSKTINTFDTRPTSFVPRYSPAFVGSTYVFNGFLSGEYYRAGFYNYESNWVMQTSALQELFDQADPGNDLKKIVTVTDYSYIPPGQTTVANDLLPRKITQTMPDGEKLVQEFKYPLDYSVSSTASDEAARGIYFLREKKIESPAIEQISYVEKIDGTKNMASGNLIMFREFPTSSGKVYPWQVFRSKPGTGNSFTSFPWSTINANVFTINSTSYKLVRFFTNYDTGGNPLGQVAEDGVQTDYTWGYNTSLLTSATTNAGSQQHQTQYVYTPLVGVTQISDPNLRNSKFSYDGFSRLNLVRDHSDQIETRYRYNYKNESLNRPDFTYTQIGDQMFQFNCIKGGEPGSQFIWDFGNGTVVENFGSVAYHTYTASGQFTVTLCITYPDNPAATVSKPLVILPPVNIQFTSPVTGSAYTVCGHASVTLQATPTGAGPYNYQWEYNYSASGNANYLAVGTNSPTLVFSRSGAQASSISIRCKITDTEGRSRYSDYATIFYYCVGQPGPSDCQPGWWWNSQLGRCEPPQGYCNEGCFWDGFQCVCY